MEAFWQDFRVGLRTLRRALGFTAVAVLTLALGLGANAAIFSAVKAVLFNRLPYPDPDRLVTISRPRPMLAKMSPSLFSTPDLTMAGSIATALVPLKYGSMKTEPDPPKARRANGHLDQDCRRDGMPVFFAVAWAENPSQGGTPSSVCW
jgi:hypothetical protein